MSWEDRPYASGGGGRRFSENPLNWSPTIGRIAGIRIRVHIVLILFIGVELLSAAASPLGSVAFALQWILVGFVSILLHEFGHCFAARAVGGRADEILMWPLGGLAFCDVPRLPWPQFVTVICGPLVTLALLSAAAALRGFHFTFELFSGWQDYAAWGSVTVWLNLIYKVNLALLLFNLWPMYPMDAGRLVQCALWPLLGFTRSLAITTTIGMVAAVVLGLWALVNTVFIVLAIAIMGYFECYRERQMLQAGVLQEEGFMGYNFSGGYTTLEGRSGRSGLIARWRHKRAEAQRRRMAQTAEAEQEEVDRILEKVHRQGMHSLTRAEKRTLQMATKRQQESTRFRV